MRPMDSRRPPVPTIYRAGLDDGGSIHITPGSLFLCLPLAEPDPGPTRRPGSLPGCRHTVLQRWHTPSFHDLYFYRISNYHLVVVSVSCALDNARTRDQSEQP